MHYLFNEPKQYFNCPIEVYFFLLFLILLAFPHTIINYSNLTSTSPVLLSGQTFWCQCNRRLCLTKVQFCMFFLPVNTVWNLAVCRCRILQTVEPMCLNLQQRVFPSYSVFHTSASFKLWHYLKVLKNVLFGWVMQELLSNMVIYTNYCTKMGERVRKLKSQKKHIIVVKDVSFTIHCLNAGNVTPTDIC